MPICLLQTRPLAEPRLAAMLPPGWGARLQALVPGGECWSLELEASEMQLLGALLHCAWLRRLSLREAGYGAPERS